MQNWNVASIFADELYVQDLGPTEVQDSAIVPVV